MGGKFVSAVAVGHELRPGEPDVLFLWPRFLLHHQFVLPGSSLSRIRMVTGGLSAALASVGSGLAAYVWLRQHCSRRAACIAAMLYTWLPYHLRIDHVERFAFADTWGLSGCP